MKKLNKLILILPLFLLPYSVFSATINIEPRGALPGLGDTAIFDIYLDTEDQTVNVIDGSIKIIDNNQLFVQNFFIAKSIFSLWPSKPVYNHRERTISFVGGIPGGIRTRHGLLFSLIFLAKKEGAVTLRPQKTIVYLNDKKATSFVAEGRDLNFTVNLKSKVATQNDWRQLIIGDKTPPRPFTISLVKDINLFGGQKFITFSTSDDETGIAYYEVKEGNFPSGRAEFQYVLQNQKEVQAIEVLAYDRAGNVRAGHLAKTFLEPNILLILIMVVFFLVIIIFSFIIKMFRQ